MSLNDLIFILSHHIEQIRHQQSISINNRMTEYRKADMKEEVDNDKNKDLNCIKQILESISVNVWKCFHLLKSLHPYSAEALVSFVDIIAIKKDAYCYYYYCFYY